MATINGKSKTYLALKKGNLTYGNLGLRIDAKGETPLPIVSKPLGSVRCFRAKVMAGGTGNAPIFEEFPTVYGD